MKALDLALPPLEIVLNRYLGSDPESLARMAALAPRNLNVELVDLAWSFCIQPVMHGVQLCAPDSGASAQVSTSLTALGRLMAGEDARGLGGRMRVTGDVEFAELLFQILRGTAFDLEAELEKLLGPVAAVRVGQGLRELLTFGRRAAAGLFDDGARYLRDESGALPAAVEVEEWMDAVDELRSGVDRLEARLHRVRAVVES